MRNPRGCTLFLVIAGLGLLYIPPNAAAQDELGDLIITDEVAPGQQLIVTLFHIPGNITLSITAPTGPVHSEEFSLEPNQTWSKAFRVTDAWWFGTGSVEASVFWNNTLYTLVETFEIICPPACQVTIILGAVSSAMVYVWAVVGALIFLVVLFGAWLSHVYAVEGNDLSWWERVVALGNPMRRSAHRIDLLNQSGHIPEEMMDKLTRMHFGVMALPEAARARKAFDAEAKALARQKDILISKFPPKIGKPNAGKIVKRVPREEFKRMEDS